MKRKVRISKPCMECGGKVPHKAAGGSVASQNSNIDQFGQKQVGTLKNFMNKNAQSVLQQEAEQEFQPPMSQEFMFGGMFLEGGNYGYNPELANIDMYTAKLAENRAMDQAAMASFGQGLQNTDFSKQTKMNTKLTKEGRQWYKDNYGMFGGAFAHGGPLPGFEWAGEVPDLETEEEYKDWIDTNYPAGTEGRTEAIKAAGKKVGAIAAVDAVDDDNLVKVDNSDYLPTHDAEGNRISNQPGNVDPNFNDGNIGSPDNQVHQVLAEQQVDKQKQQQRAKQQSSKKEDSVNNADNVLNKRRGDIDASTLNGESGSATSTGTRAAQPGNTVGDDLGHITARVRGRGLQDFTYDPRATYMTDYMNRKGLLGSKTKMKFAHYAPGYGQQTSQQNTSQQDVAQGPASNDPGRADIANMSPEELQEYKNRMTGWFKDKGNWRESLAPSPGNTSAPGPGQEGAPTPYNTSYVAPDSSLVGEGPLANQLPYMNVPDDGEMVLPDDMKQTAQAVVIDNYNKNNPNFVQPTQQYGGAFVKNDVLHQYLFGGAGKERREQRRFNRQARRQERKDIFNPLAQTQRHMDMMQQGMNQMQPVMQQANPMNMMGGHNPTYNTGGPLAETTIQSGYTAKQFQPFIGGAMDFTAMIGRSMTEGDYEQDLMNQTSAHNLFTANEGVNRGMNTFNKVGYDPGTDATFAAKYGGSFKEGGSVTMSDEDIKTFLAMGGTIEYLD